MIERPYDTPYSGPGDGPCPHLDGEEPMTDPLHPDQEPLDAREDECDACFGTGVITRGPEDRGCEQCGGDGLRRRPLMQMLSPEPVTRGDVDAARATSPTWLMDPPSLEPGTKLTTYELIQAAGALTQMLYRIPPEDDTSLGDHLEKAIFQWMERVEDKVEGLYFVIKRMKAEAALLQAEEGRLAKRRVRIQKQQKRLEGLAKELLQEHREVSGEGYVTTATFTARLQKSPPRVEIATEGLPFEVLADLDAFFASPPPKLDKKRLAEALKAGRNVPGAKLVQDEHVRFE